MHSNKIFIRGVIIGIIVTAAMTPFISFSALAVVRSIKPVAKQSVPLSDEQQGILAVRKAKAAVISIIGSIAPAATSTASSTGLTATVVPHDEVEGTGFILEQN